MSALDSTSDFRSTASADLATSPGPSSRNTDVHEMMRKFTIWLSAQHTHKHKPQLASCSHRLSKGSCGSATRICVNIKLDFIRYLNDSVRVVAILGQRVLERLSAIQE
ncbi:hypothetical protein [Bradyrhizobium sp. RDM4]|uniref:hypothetical protein n=1 Tax=Bradyrhizobium sp. RDM4 TaxID=3378765 RepID=UPI0038FCBEF8